MRDRWLISLPVGVGVLSQPFNSYGVIGPISVADIGLLLALGSLAVQQTLRGEGRVARGIQPLVVDVRSASALVAGCGGTGDTVLDGVILDLE